MLYLYGYKYTKIEVYMDLNEIKDPELLAMFEEYEKEFQNVKKKAPEKKPSKPKGKMRVRYDDFDGGIRNFVWEYM